MSQKVLARLQARMSQHILGVDNFRGDEEALVAPSAWVEVARFIRDDPECAMNHFIDLTVVDFPEREPNIPRFDVVLFVRSLAKNHRVRLKARVRDGEEIESLCSVWKGADWTEREAYDMFGIRFRNHPDLRRILMYEEFVGYPLRKDYPIDKTQPLIPYRDVPAAKLNPFGADMGNPYGRIDWLARMSGRNLQVSPAIAVQQGQRPALSVDVEDLAEPTAPAVQTGPEPSESKPAG